MSTPKPRGEPLYLAVARILFFASALLSLPPLDAARSYAHLPSALIVPPSNGGHLLTSLPITDTWIVVAYGLTLGGAILGLIGLLPRLASAVYVVGAFYYLGVPQIYGKVDHSHYLLWIGAIFAVSRSADALSLQALWAAWRRPEEQPVEPVHPSLQYSLPLRFNWLLLGFIYLSAGSAKYRFDGLVWFQPDTLRHWLHLLWFQSGYRPPILHGVDHFSPLLVVGAAFTLVFETTFILWIFSERARPFLAGAAIVFHNGTKFLMNIWFLGLQVVDLTLVDWERLSFAAFRRRMPLSFVYDGNCGTCKKTVMGLRSLALPGSVAFVNALDREEMRRRGIDWLDSDATLRDVHVVVGKHASVGFEAYRAVARRVPALWPFLPFLALPPVATLGRRVYRQGRGQPIVLRRACARLHSRTPPSALACRRSRRATTRRACRGRPVRAPVGASEHDGYQRLAFCLLSELRRRAARHGDRACSKGPGTRRDAADRPAGTATIHVVRPTSRPDRVYCRPTGSCEPRARLDGAR